MLQEVFYWIFNMSITAALTGVLIMLVRLIKGIPRRMTAFLWIIPFLRMTIPLGLDSPYSLMTLLSKITTKTVVVFQPTDKISFSMMNTLIRVFMAWKAADSFVELPEQELTAPERTGFTVIEWGGTEVQ